MNGKGLPKCRSHVVVLSSCDAWFRIDLLYQIIPLFMLWVLYSTFEKTPIFDVEGLQYPLLDLLAVLHQLRSLALLGLLVLARVMRDVYRDHEVCLLLFQTQQHELNIHVLRDLAIRVGVGRWRLDEAQCVDRLVAAKSSVADS